MKFRKIAHTDRENILSSFKPMFGNYDDLHMALAHLEHIEYLGKSGEKRKLKR